MNTSPQPTRLVLAPATAGKTYYCIEQLRNKLQATPLADVWVIVPDRTQAVSFRRRLAEAGGAIGAHVGTFGDLYNEVLGRAGQPLPVAPPQVTHRLVRSAIDALARQGQLQHYLPIQRRPGFTLALARLIAELKRARIEPPDFARAVQGRGQRLEELAALYGEYQEALIRLGWADPEGLGWLAVEALQAAPAPASGMKLVIVDGFDSFTPTQVEAMRLLSLQIEELVITLAGEPGMARMAHRRFARTLTRLQVKLALQVETLPRSTAASAQLAHLEAGLFIAGAARLAPETAVTFAAVQTQALEAREALRWTKARIVRDGVPADKCAIIAYDTTPYQPFLREAATEFGVPLRFAAGEPLARNPATAALLNLLELTIENWARRKLLDALRAPYFDLSAFSLTAPDVDQLDEAARYGQVIEGLDQWQEALDRLARRTETTAAEPEDEPTGPQLPSGAVALALWQRLLAFARRVTPPETATLTGFVAWIEDLMSAKSGLGLLERATSRPETADRDLSALGILREVLRALVLSEQVIGEQAERAFADFYTELRGAVEAAAHVPEAEGIRGVGRVYAADLSQARGVPYRAVVVLGLAEGLFPAPLTEDPFLADEERESLLAAGLLLEPRLRSDQQTLFYEAVTRASEYLLLTRPYLADDGETWEPSPYWNAALGLFEAKPRRIRLDDRLPFVEAASAGELLASAVRARALPATFAELRPEWDQLRHAGSVLAARVARQPRGEHEGELVSLVPALAARFGPEHVWSASRLEAYSSCGFQFYISRALGLEERETPSPGYDAAQLGSMLHEILEEVYQRAADTLDIETVVAALPAVARELFDSAPERFGFRATALWEAERAELIEKLEATLRALADEPGRYRPVALEARFGLQGKPLASLETSVGPVLYHGVIDRVDQDEQGQLRIIDYKSGSSGLSPADLEQGRRLQLPLYAHAAEAALHLGPVAEGFYWKIRQAKAGSLRLSRFQTKSDGALRGPGGAIRLVANYVADYVRGIRAGEFQPVAPDGGCPVYCPARLFCWRYTPGYGA